MLLAARGVHLLRRILLVPMTPSDRLPLRPEIGGTLRLVPVVLRGLILHPDDGRDPYAFRIDLRPFGLDTARLLFRRLPGQPPSLCFELYPVSLQTVSAPHLIRR